MNAGIAKPDKRYLKIDLLSILRWLDISTV